VNTGKRRRTEKKSENPRRKIHGIIAIPLRIPIPFLGVFPTNRFGRVRLSIGLLTYVNVREDVPILRGLIVLLIVFFSHFRALARHARSIKTGNRNYYHRLQRSKTNKDRPLDERCVTLVKDRVCGCKSR
jgi:hypothetical protein